MSSADKFDASRANEYAEQSRIALAGYEACHELAACLLSSALGRGSEAHVLVVGVGGTANEIIVSGRLEQRWRFTGVDPSPPMLAGAQAAVETAGLSARANWYAGRVDELPADDRFDAATLIGVLHHLAGREAKLEILREIACRLKPGAPFILACNRGTYRANPVFLNGWANRWRMAGTADEQVQAKIGKILEGADPPASDGEVGTLLSDAGFASPQLFFSSLFWGGWIVRHRDRRD